MTGREERFQMIAASWHFWDIFTSRIFWCGFGGWIFASVFKIVFTAMKTGEIDFVKLVSTGGMPSSHSATVSALAVGIGVSEGFDAPATVLAVAFAVITMLDAATVRRAAGEHAKVLNAIVSDIKELKFKPGKRFKELLGHTRTEVFWGMIAGIAWAAALCAVWEG